jgi:hypothetical protein
MSTDIGDPVPEFECWDILVDHGAKLGNLAMCISHFVNDGPKFMIMGQVSVDAEYWGFSDALRALHIINGLVTCHARQVIKLTGKAKSTVMDHVTRVKYALFTENRQVPLRRYKELGAIGHSAAKVSLIHASNVDAILKHFKTDGNVIVKFVHERRTTAPPACRHRAGAAARDHLIIGDTPRQASPARPPPPIVPRQAAPAMPPPPIVPRQPTPARPPPPPPTARHHDVEEEVDDSTVSDDHGSEADDDDGGMDGDRDATPPPYDEYEDLDREGVSLCDGGVRWRVEVWRG